MAELGIASSPASRGSGAPALPGLPSRRDGQVLVVDDDVGTRDTFGTILSRAGFSVTAVADVAAALSLLSRVPVGLVLLDRRLGEEDGLDHIRISTRTEKCPAVVVVTASADVSSVVEAMRLGALSVAEKPLTGDDLVDLVQNYGTFPSPDSNPTPTLSPLIRPSLGIPEFLDLAGALLEGHPLKLIGSRRRVLRRRSRRAQRIFQSRVQVPVDARLREFVRLLTLGRTVDLCRNEAGWGAYFEIDGSHFGRLLGRQTGLRFSDWHVIARVKRAVYLLATTDVCVWRVADLLGEEPSQMSREFKEILSVSPSTFRTAIGPVLRKAD